MNNQYHGMKSLSNEVRLTSLGTLELNLKLTLTLTQLNLLNVKMSDLKKFSNISVLFTNTSYDITDQIALSTDNYLINSLLFINRTNKQKTFIEYLVTSEICYSPEDSFFKPILKKVTDRHLLFIIENRLTTIPSDIIFTLTIINTETNKLHGMKSFFLPTTTSTIDSDIPICSSLLTMLPYKISCDYFFCNFADLIKIQTIMKNDEIIHCFFNDLNSKYPRVKIICSFTNNLFGKNKSVMFLDAMKKAIEFSDITIVDNDVIEQFYKLYTLRHQHEYRSLHQGSRSHSSNKDAIIHDGFHKKRKSTNKITIILEQMKTISIIQQDCHSKVIQQNTDFYLHVDRNEEEQRMIINNYHYFQSVFIGGYLSRLLYNKTYQTCYIAGNKSFKLLLTLMKRHIDISPDLSYYEVVVYNKKKKSDLSSLIEREFFHKREKSFRLDGNQTNLKVLNYNAMRDNSRSSFNNSFFHHQHFKKQGIVNKEEVKLKEPIQESTSKEKLDYGYKRNLIQLNINKRKMKNSASTSNYSSQSMKNSIGFNGLQQKNGMGPNTKEAKSSITLAPVKENKKCTNQKKQNIDHYIPKDSFYKVLNQYEEKVRNNLNKTSYDS